MVVDFEKLKYSSDTTNAKYNGISLFFVKSMVALAVFTCEELSSDDVFPL